VKTQSNRYKKSTVVHSPQPKQQQPTVSCWH